MYSTAAKMHFITRLNTSFRSDLLWWNIFLQAWNGFSILRYPAVSHSDVWVQTDASGAWGCAAVLVSVKMASTMVQYRNHGPGAGADHFYLH